MSAEAPGPELRLEAEGIPARLSLPLRVRVQGIDAVLVSATAYDGLAQSSRRRRLSRIERDPEVRAFFDAGFSTREMRELREAAIVRFGKDRTPSLSALGRYALARRSAAEAFTRPAIR